jgi:hypothetical protein
LSSYFNSLNLVRGSVDNAALLWWNTFIQRVVNLAEKKHVKFAFVDQAPTFIRKTEVNYQLCTPEWFRVVVPDCASYEIAERQPLHKALSEKLAEYSRSSKSFSYVDLSALYCSKLRSLGDGSLCKNIAGNSIFYRDATHFTAQGSMLLKDDLFNYIFKVY